MKKQLLIIIICLFTFINEAFSQSSTNYKITCLDCKGLKKCTHCFDNRALCLICNGSKKHTGECPNCKNWNESYRSQVPCHRCKNTREVVLPGCEYCKSTGKCQYCNGSKTCNNCKGKGYFDPLINLKESNLVKLPKASDCNVEIKLIERTGYSYPTILNTYIFNDKFYPTISFDKEENIIIANNKRIAIKVQNGNYYSLLNNSYSLDDELTYEDLDLNFSETNIEGVKKLFYIIPNMKNKESLWLIYNDKKTGCDIVANALLIDPNTKKMFIDAVDK